VGTTFVSRLRARLAGTRRASLEDLLRLAYPEGLERERHSLAVALAAGDDPFDASVARRILGGFEQQIGGPRLLVRFGPNDVDLVDVAGTTMALDRSDASVSVQVRSGAYEPHVDSVLRSLRRPGSVFVAPPDLPATGPDGT
jgi:hypothetical protein